MPSGVWPGLRKVFRPRAPSAPSTQAQLPYKRTFLREIDIFRDLPTDDLTWLEGTTRMATVRKGQIIYHQDERVEGLFLLKRGRVRLARLSPGGKRLDLAVLEPGTFFGEMPLLGERMRNASAEAVEDSTLCVMSQADIEGLVLRRPQVALLMLEVLGRRLAESEARLEDLAYRSVPARVASVLLRLARTDEGVIEGITHQELGDMVGAYRETVTKILNEFRAAGMVALGRQRIRLLDRAALARMLEE